MYEYQFVKIYTEGTLVKKLPNYQEIINQNAADGWRLVQIFNPIYEGAYPSFIEIVLEREIKEEKNKYWELP